MTSLLKFVLSMHGMAKFMFNYIARMNEDCLYLNVYTPQVGTARQASAANCCRRRRGLAL